MPDLIPLAVRHDEIEGLEGLTVEQFPDGFRVDAWFAFPKEARGTTVQLYQVGRPRHRTVAGLAAAYSLMGPPPV
jgi:hypothetical protein